MTSTAGFKQQCPSCEAMIPIKDRKLIGRKVICPRCQYRFVVVDPDAQTEEEAASEKPGPTTKAASSPATGKPAVSRGAAGKDKIGQRHRSSKAQEAGDEATGQKRRFSRTVVMGAVLAGVAVIFLVAAVLALTGWPSRVFSTLFTRNPPRPGPTRTAPLTDKSTGPSKNVSPDTAADDLVNMVPASAEAVFVLNWARLKDSELLYDTLFKTPGALDATRIKKQLGFSLDDIDRFVRAESYTERWSFNIIRLAVAVNPDQLKEPLGLEPRITRTAKNYFVFTSASKGGSMLRELSNLAVRAGATAPRVEVVRSYQGLYMPDDKTILIGDIDPLERFVENPRATTKPPHGSSFTVDHFRELLDDRTSILATAIDTQKGSRAVERVALVLKLENPQQIRDFVKDCAVLRLSVQSITRQPALVADLQFDYKDATAAGNAVSLLRDHAVQAKISSTLAGLLGIDPKNATGPSPVTQPKAASVRVHLEQTFNESGARVQNYLERKMLFLTGLAEMDDRSMRTQELADALAEYTKKNGMFPPGTQPRPDTFTDANLPWPADQRVSWMVDLLPYLPPFNDSGNSYDADGKRLPLKVKVKESWRHSDNALAALTLIPQFLGPKTPENTWWVRYPGTTSDVAATHFVGMAGVGLDAAEYSAQDASVAGKLGVFGYDRATSLADVKDGLDKTIALIQVPPEFQTPWLAGGGSTIRGVREPDPRANPDDLSRRIIRPFVCLEHEGKRGTFAVMADGKVRFLPEDIADEDFKALCTINGGEKIDVDKVAPLVPRAKK